VPEFLFTPKIDFFEVAVMLGFVQESVKYLQCKHFVLFMLLVVEVVERVMQFP
jgi:hypothetical protein